MPQLKWRILFYFAGFDCDSQDGDVPMEEAAVASQAQCILSFELYRQKEKPFKIANPHTGMGP